MGIVVGNIGLFHNPATGEAVVCRKLTNNDGGQVTKGLIVEADTVDADSFALIGAVDTQPIGVVWDATINNGSAGWVAVQGIADVALEDNTGSDVGNWVQTSDNDVGGYADATNVAPPGGAVAALDTHMQEIGHCVETVAAGGGGTHVLARCLLHFN